jgi:uracil-DNA glycosylase
MLASPDRRSEIEQEVLQASPAVLITLGDQPLRWFTRHFGSMAKLGSYGETADTYGRLHDIQVAGQKIKLLPLVHPRQAAGLGTHSLKWAGLHTRWMQDVAESLVF